MEAEVRLLEKENARKRGLIRKLNQQYVFEVDFLGNRGHFSSSAVQEAQLWFERGLIWMFSFNHAEAISCYNRALSYDVKMVMAMWGISYANGPNYASKDMDEHRNTMAVHYMRRAADVIAGVG